MLSVMIDWANAAGIRWAAWIVVASLDAALLLVLVGLLWLAIRNRVAPQVGYALFLLIPLKMLMPFAVTVPAVVASWTPSTLVASWCGATSDLGVIEANASGDSATSVASVDRGGGVESLAAPILVAEGPSSMVSDPEVRRESAVMPTANVADRSGAELPRLSVSAMAMTGWMAVVLLLVGRFVVAQLSFRRRLGAVAPFGESSLPVGLGEVRRRSGVRREIRIVESEGIASPAVWGIARPTIILPKGIAAALTAEQFRWVLLHEMAHIRRQDLIVAAFQRFAAILHFFNPAIWIANRMIHQLREYRCDDLALSQGGLSPVESGEAFVKVLRHAARGHGRLAGSLGIFGLDSRGCSLRRARRLLDSDRQIRVASGARSIAAFILFAVVTVPHLRASGEGHLRDPQELAAGPPAQGQAITQADAAEPLDDGFGEFELRIVGPDGKPIAGAEVELRTEPHPTAARIRRGRFVRDGRYGAFVAADAEGMLAVELPPDPKSFDVFIQIPGYGPYSARWSSEDHNQPISPRLTAELEAAWSVGGVIVDDAGNPVEGAGIGLSIEYKKPPGDARQLGAGARVKTGAAGRWRFDSVPASMGEVHVEINHPSFQPIRQSLTRAAFGFDRGGEPSGKIAMKHGVTVSGKVTDATGKPVVGALVRTKFLNDVREAQSGPDGIYRLVGCEPKTARIVVSAKGLAMDMKQLSIEPEMGPVDFSMKPGGTVRVRVLDAEGRPSGKARIFFQRWRGPLDYFEFDHINGYADEDGIWTWDEAPLDEFKADICPADGMQLLEQPLVAREEEYVLRLLAPLVVTGKVADAETKEPIKEFRVIPGIRSTPTRMNWARGLGFAATNGRFQYRPDRAYLAHLIRIEADGYRPAVAREIKSTEGNVSIDFELKRGINIAAKVVTAAERPAVRAKVALGIAGSQIEINNGKIDATYAAWTSTDAEGRFLFPAQASDFQLVIAHPEGFAHIKSTPDWDPGKHIQLEPWSRVEGTFRVGKMPVANASITISVSRPDSYGEGVPSIFTHYNSTTGPDGRFTFERVVPGPGRIGRRIMLTVDDGSAEATSSCMVPVDFPAGKTAHINLGGDGRRVVGVLQPPEGFGREVRWNFALVQVVPTGPGGRSAGPFLTGTVDRDGRFCFDDVPAGDYSLSVRFDRDGAGFLSGRRFKVPPGGDPAPQPIDLGQLRLEGR